MHNNQSVKSSKLVSLVLGTTMVASMLLMGNSSSAWASTESPITANEAGVSTGTLYTTNGYTKPDAPVTFKLNMTKDVLDVLHLSYANGALTNNDQGSSAVGVLLTDGTNSTLATTANGLLSYSTDGTTLSIMATHPLLQRYTSYSAYLLVGSAMHKYESLSNSNGHSNAFSTVSQDALDATRFKTGSAIGESTKVTAQVQNSSVKVTDGGTLNVSDTDDYGDPATSATLTVTGSGKGNTRVPSDFSVPNTTQITNGTAVVPLTDHSAETVNISYTVADNTHHDSLDTNAGQLSEVFLPGQATDTEITIPSKLISGQSATVSGYLTDQYGNPIINTDIVFSGALSGTLTTDINGNYSGSLKIKQSGSATASVDGNTITLNGQSSIQITAVSAITSPVKLAHLPAGVSNGTLVALSNDEVLYIGGYNKVTGKALNSVYAYSVQDNTWKTVAPTLQSFYSGHAVVLKDGRVLITGTTIGRIPTNLLSPEIYDPKTDSWTIAQNYPSVYGASITALQDGTVMIAGGENTSSPFSSLSSAYIYNPNTATSKKVADMPEPAKFGSMMTLPDGRAIYADGNNGNNPSPYVQIYDPTTNTWTGLHNAYGSVWGQRTNPVLSLLPDGNVAIWAGSSDSFIADDLNLLSPSTMTMKDIGYGYSKSNDKFSTDSVDHILGISTDQATEPWINQWTTLPNGDLFFFDVYTDYYAGYQQPLLQTSLNITE